MRAALRQEIETKEKSLNNQEPSLDEPLIPTAGAFLSAAQNSKIRTQNTKVHKLRSCTYCEGNHRPDKCHQISRTQERRQFLQRQRRCFNCLGPNHTKAQCYSKGRCMKCKKKHHTSICDDAVGENSEEESPQQSTKNDETGGSQTTTKKADNSKTHMGATHADRNSILMQTAIVKASKDGTNQYQARILFDTGSQRTFISEHLKQKLRLEPIRQELLDVTTFGTLKSNRETTNRKYRQDNNSACVASHLSATLLTNERLHSPV